MIKDLFGADLVWTLPMVAPLPWRVFKLNDCDWWVARTLEEAKADCRYQCGDIDFEDEHELSDADLDRLKFCDEDCSSKSHSFREELRLRIEAGITKPEFFASTEH